MSDGLKKGEIRFWLNGKKLKGGFTLVLTRYQGNRKNWLLIKEKDEYARKGSNITEEQPNSAYSGKSIEEIAILK